MANETWRIVLITTVAPVADALAGALRAIGHEPVAVMSARRRQPGAASPYAITDASVPAGLDVLIPRDRHSIEPLMRGLHPEIGRAHV